jgi:hypothetical protein
MNRGQVQSVAQTGGVHSKPPSNPWMKTTLAPQVVRRARKIPQVRLRRNSISRPRNHPARSKSRVVGKPSISLVLPRYEKYTVGSGVIRGARVRSAMPVNRHVIYRFQRSAIVLTPMASGLARSRRGKTACGAGRRDRALMPPWGTPG